ncbi:unnamed protein product [Rotaria sordida]|uniref:Uncharacterized protein n=1 Tax=Rotaria sordida TaxID=392033 RepID=A0A819TC86_9BILA|nr:unnamed protein product [Rotaria sordida]
MSLIFKLQFEYDDALNVQRRALQIRNENIPLDHLMIAKNLEEIGNILFQQVEYDDALNFYQQALTIFEENCPTDHTEIANCLHEIALIWNSKMDYDRAIEYFERCLCIREASLSLDDPVITDTLLYSNLIREKRNHREHSLAYEINYCLMCIKFRPLDQVIIGDSFSRIGQHYEHLNEPKLAIDYYKQALSVYQYCLPEWHESRIDMELNIERLSKETTI